MKHTNLLFFWAGILNELQSAVLYSLGPRYDSFSKCVAHGEHLSAQVRCKMSRQLHITTLEQALKHLSRSVDTPSEQTMVCLKEYIGPISSNYIQFIEDVLGLVASRA